jgi:hypothetical protein
MQASPELRQDSAAALRSLIHRCSIVVGTAGVDEFARTQARAVAREASWRLQRQARQYARAGEPQRYSRTEFSTVPATEDEFGDLLWVEKQAEWCKRRIQPARKQP